MSTLERKKLFFKTVFIIAIVTLIAGISFYKIITHGLYLSPDSYIYLDIAQNIQQGRGLVHSFVLTSELDRWEGNHSYVPMGYWAPGFPIYLFMTKTIGRFRSFATSGAVSIWITLVATLITLSLMLTHIYNFRASLWGILFFSLFYPITYSYSWVWSDGVVIPFMLGTLWLIIENKRSHYKMQLFLAGIFAGVAFSIRYIQGILLPYGFLILLLFGFIQNKNISLKAKGINTLLYSIIYWSGWLCFSTPVLLRNWIVTETWLGPPRPTNSIPLFHNMKYAFNSLIKEGFSPVLIPTEIQPALILAFFLVCLLLLIIRKRHISIREIFYNHFFLICLGWAMIYLLSITLYASFYQMDLLGHRLLLPFSMVMMVILSAICERIFPIPTWGIAMGVVLSLFSFYNSYPCESAPFSTTMTVLQNNPRVEWICSNTHAGDWIIGDSTFDITLLCNDRRSLCFVPGTSLDIPPSKKEWDTFFQKKGTDTSRVFIVLRKGVPFEEVYYDDWVKYFGNVITELFFTGKYGDMITTSVYSGKGFLSAEVRKQKE